MDYSFAEETEELVRLSREEALRLGHDYIGSEHFLLAIIREGKSEAIKILVDLRCDLINLKRSIEKEIKVNGGTLSLGNIPLTKNAEKILKISKEESKIFNSINIDIVHILLAILKDEECVACRILEMKKISYKSFLTVYKKKISIDQLSKNMLPLFKENGLDLCIDPGNCTKNDIIELYESLSDLQRAFGGIGITFKNQSTEIYEVSEVLI